MNIVLKILGASIGLYVAAYIIGLALPAWDCYGWECETITCPPQMAVYVPEKGYLPCDKFNEYIDTEDERLLVK